MIQLQQCQRACVAGMDDGEVVRLYHPRVDEWSEHFRWDGAEMVGTTAIGRATVHTLDVNEPLRVLHRESLMAEDLYPAVPTSGG